MILKEKKEKKNFNKLKPTNNIKHTNIHILGVQGGKERKKEIKNIFEEIMAENFPNLKKKMDVQVQEAQRNPKKMSPNRPTPRCIIIKMAKVKQRILKAAREKHIKSKTLITRELTSLSADFFTEMLQAKGSDKIYSKPWKVKAYNLGYSTQQVYLEQKER